MSTQSVRLTSDGGNILLSYVFLFSNKRMEWLLWNKINPELQLDFILIDLNAVLNNFS